MIDPQKVVFVGKVRALASVNIDGEFDVLPAHTNLIAVIYREVVLYLPDNQQKKYPIDIAVLRFANNEADVYLGVDLSEAPDDLRSSVLGSNPKPPVQNRQNQVEIQPD